MLHTDEQFSKQVERAVQEIERGTDAELVVVAAPRSGSYRDLAIAAGAVVAWMVLLFLLFSPYSFAPTWMPLELFVIGLFVSWQTHRSPSVLRLLSRSSRLKRQVENAAALAFHEESVAGTRGRTGLLIYVSALEDRVVLIPDSGLDALIPRGVWNSVPWGEGRNPDQPGDLDHFLAGLSKVGEVLADAVPASEDNPDEISNAPRIRS